jgi:hypothetical protein
MNKFKLFSLYIFLNLLLTHYTVIAKPDQFVALDGKPNFRQESNAWYKLTIPFRVLDHPLASTSGNSSLDPAKLIHEDYLDDLKIKVTICFRNDYSRKKLGGAKKDIKFFEYFSSETELITIDVDRSSKREVNFLFPKIVADKMELGFAPELIGYVLEFSVNGALLEVSKGVAFESYSSEDILSKFRSEALSKSSENEGILIPAHFISQNYLDNLGPVKREHQ